MADSNLTYRIIGGAMDVHNELGPGLQEKPYENALDIALRESGFRVEQQPRYPIRFRGQIVGDCAPDLVVEREVIIDVKSIDSIGDNEVAQMLNYLRIAKLQLGLIINFKNPKVDVKRVAL